MLSTTLDILYLVLSIGLGILLLSLTVLTWYVVGTFRRINRITDLVEDSVDTMNTYVKLPAGFLFNAMDWVKDNDIFPGKKKKN
ncbi:hypothetical protein COW46_02720 [Candidatus Gracilibacteria bacterium CG17_big_fil_post_rev_8_21_14_2_50_48_13]|nr:MAG: hypothetical protein COW46_02720 [Candidatus Gracilibacteria bacterium CG17_big_fil_post_rev_8_21_14_2_50_48_13]